MKTFLLPEIKTRSCAISEPKQLQQTLESKIRLVNRENNTYCKEGAAGRQTLKVLDKTTIELVQPKLKCDVCAAPFNLAPLYLMVSNEFPTLGDEIKNHN